MRPATVIAIALACSGLLTAIALWNGQLRVWLWAPLALAVAWFVLRRGRPWLSAVLCAALVTVAALGVLFGGSAWAALGGVLGALAAWDLTHFEHAALAHTRVDDGDLQFRSHIRHLGLALGSGVALSTIALMVRVSATFGLLVALFVTAIALARLAIRAERRTSDASSIE